MNNSRRTRNLIAALGVAVVLTLSLGGWAAGSAGAAAGTPAPGMITATRTPAEFKKAIADFPAALPDGVTWPKVTPKTLLEDDTQYHHAVPVLVASNYWLCAWEAEYIGAHDAGDSLAEANAMANIEKYLTFPFLESIWAPGQMNLWYSDTFESAQAGDFTNVRADYRSCGEFAVLK